MTKDEINKAVAEKVMGWTIRDTKRLYYYEPGILISEWNPAERIDHAWMVLEKFQYWTMNKLGDKVFFRIVFDYDEEKGIGKWTKAEADTAPMAICLAALEAVRSVPPA